MKVFKLLLVVFGLFFDLQPSCAFAEKELTEEKAQQIAEKAVHQPFNKDKVLGLKSKTTTIEAKMSRLVRKITGLADSNTRLGGAKAGIDERLARLGAQMSDTEVRITLKSAVLFAFDRFDLRVDGLDTLEDVFEVLKSYPKSPVVIEGHTCSIGTNAYNSKLSKKRATSVANWLKKRGLPRRRFSLKAFGESRPVADNNIEGGRRKNRRVEIVIKK